MSLLITGHHSRVPPLYHKLDKVMCKRSEIKNVTGLSKMEKMCAG